MLIGLVVSSEVNCGPGLQVTGEPAAEHRVVLPGGHCLPLRSLSHQRGIDPMGGMQPFLSIRVLEKTVRETIMKKLCFNG